MDNAAKLIEKILEEDLKPKARWRFTLRNSIAWIGFLFAVIIGALAFSVILFAIQQIDFNIIDHMSHSFFELMLALIPLFWIICLILFLSIAVVSLKNSKKGYRFGSVKLVGLCIALSLLAGTLFFISRGAKFLEQAFAVNVSIYESIQDKKTKMWTMPEDGFISGTIISVDENTFILNDFTEKNWIIDFQDAHVVPSIQIVSGEKIKIIGKMTTQDSFVAEKIRPWGGADRMNRNNQKK